MSESSSKAVTIVRDGEQRRRPVAWVVREVMPNESGVRAWLRQSMAPARG